MPPPVCPSPVRVASRLVAAGAVLFAVLLGMGVPAAHAADDIYEVDMRLAAAGFVDAYTEAWSTEDRGTRLRVDVDSDSPDRAAYELQAAQIGKIIWEHLDGRVLAVDVTPTYGVVWADGGLPPGVSMTADDLRAAHGVRTEGLDSGDADTVDDEMVTGLVMRAVLWLGSIAAASAGPSS